MVNTLNLGKQWLTVFPFMLKMLRVRVVEWREQKTGEIWEVRFLLGFVPRHFSLSPVTILICNLGLVITAKYTKNDFSGIT